MWPILDALEFEQKLRAVKGATENDTMTLRANVAIALLVEAFWRRAKRHCQSASQSNKIDKMRRLLHSCCARSARKTSFSELPNVVSGWFRQGPHGEKGPCFFSWRPLVKLAAIIKGSPRINNASLSSKDFLQLEELNIAENVSVLDVAACWDHEKVKEPKKGTTFREPTDEALDAAKKVMLPLIKRHLLESELVLVSLNSGVAVGKALREALEDCTSEDVTAAVADLILSLRCLHGEAETKRPLGLLGGVATLYFMATAAHLNIDKPHSCAGRLDLAMEYVGLAVSVLTRSDDAPTVSPVSLCENNGRLFIRWTGGGGGGSTVFTDVAKFDNLEARQTRGEDLSAPDKAWFDAANREKLVEKDKQARGRRGNLARYDKLTARL
mmetsp:Transcript_2597/g.7779  ORF Transcript_2597/g.7779 Transcript_2597/m.7779 type:complete len:384 (+) Transcript_2597:243-1394(+)